VQCEIETKYYSAAVKILGMYSSSTEFEGVNAEAIIFAMHAADDVHGFNMLTCAQNIARIIPPITDVPIKLFVVNDCSSFECTQQISLASSAKVWCEEREIELLWSPVGELCGNVQPSVETEARHNKGILYDDLEGFDRVVETLQCHRWPSAKFNSSRCTGLFNHLDKGLGANDEGYYLGQQLDRMNQLIAKIQDVRRCGESDNFTKERSNRAAEVAMQLAHYIGEWDDTRSESEDPDDKEPFDSPVYLSYFNE